MQAASNTGNLNYLLRQEVNVAGFYLDGSIAGPVTNALTADLEEFRGKLLSLDVKATLHK